MSKVARRFLVASLPLALAVACGKSGGDAARGAQGTGGSAGASGGVSPLAGAFGTAGAASGSGGAAGLAAGATAGVSAGSASGGTTGGHSPLAGSAGSTQGGAGNGESSGGSGSGGAGSGGDASAGAAGEPGSSVHAEDAAFCRAELDAAAEQYSGFVDAYSDPTNVPRSAKGGSVRRVALSDWTSGFPAGSFWLLYEHTRDMGWRAAAEQFTAALSGQSTRKDTHDIGFIINNTFGQGYRLMKNETYAATVRQAATALATRFNGNVGATRSWDFGSWSFPVIIDNMMNLELLFRATELGSEDVYAQMAVTHALTTQKNHFRSDMSSYHVVDYDPTTGAVIKKQTNQGVADESAWARGQAWGLYGFTLCFRESGDERFLQQAQGIADFYTQAAAMPEDGVPYFDFDTFGDASIPDHRDASAGAIATSALFELARYAEGEAAERYLTFALKAIRSLSSASYRAGLGQNSYFLLTHSVGNYPQDDEIDVAINYADYYYLEALLRCSALD